MTGRNLAMALLALLAAGIKAPALAGDTVTGIHLVLQANPNAHGSGSTRQLVKQSVEVIRRQLSSLTSKQVKVTSGGDQIEADIPGFVGLARVRALFAPRPALTLHLVDEKLSERDFRNGSIPPDVEVLNQMSKPNEPKPRLAVYREPLLSGERIVRAFNALDEHTGNPIILIQLDRRGARTIAEITREHVAGRLAFVLGDEVISAPFVREPITGGELQIDGGFTQDDAADLGATLDSSGIPPPFRLLNLSVVRFPRR